MPIDHGDPRPAAPYFVAAVVFAAVSLAILVLAFFERPVESSIALATVVAGVPAYVAFATSRDRGVVTRHPVTPEGIES